jgi:hypothetical protein
MAVTPRPSPLGGVAPGPAPLGGVAPLGEAAVPSALASLGGLLSVCLYQDGQTAHYDAKPGIVWMLLWL